MSFLKSLREKLAPYERQLSTIGILVLIWAIFLSASPGAFLKLAVYRTLMRTIPFTLLLGLGLTYIIALKEIDMSFASIMAFSAWAFTWTLTSTGSAVISTTVGIAVGFALGLMNGVVITKARVPSIVATLATMFLWQGATMVASNGASTSLYWMKDTTLYRLLVYNWVIPVQMLWGLAASFIFWLFLFRHRFGSHLLAIGDNEMTARSLGINVDRVKITSFGLMGIMSAIAGIMINMEVLSFFPSMGEGYLLPVMAAVFVGGTALTGGSATILGTIIGAIIIGSLDTGVTAMGISGFWINVIYGAIILIATVLQSSTIKGG